MWCKEERTIVNRRKISAVVLFFGGTAETFVRHLTKGTAERRNFFIQKVAAPQLFFLRRCNCYLEAWEGPRCTLAQDAGVLRSMHFYHQHATRQPFRQAVGSHSTILMLRTRMSCLPPNEHPAPCLTVSDQMGSLHEVVAFERAHRK